MNMSDKDMNEMKIKSETHNLPPASMIFRMFSKRKVKYCKGLAQNSDSKNIYKILNLKFKREQDPKMA